MSQNDIKKRIIEALDKSGKTRQALGDLLGVGRGAVSDMLKKEGEFDSLKYLEATAELTGYSFDWLRTGEGPELEYSKRTTVAEPNLKNLALNVAREGNELIDELQTLREETARLKFENEILRSALREIGAGRKEVNQ